MIRLNLGCADLPLPREDGWINIDISDSAHIRADLTMDCTKLSDHFGKESVDEVYCGHLVEHLYPKEAEEAMEDWAYVLKPGGTLGIVTPDLRWLCQAYLDGRVEWDEMNNRYLYSYIQESWHRQLFDAAALRALFARHGFTDLTEIDRMTDKRLAYPSEMQVGVQGTKV